MANPYTLRPYQEEGVAAACAALERGKSEILSMPTGSGKSLMVAGVADYFDCETLVLQPNREILKQNFSKLFEFGHRDIGIYSASAGVKRKAKITFATIGSIINKLEMFKGTELILIDECHLVNAQAGRYKNLIETLGVPVMGLTATPFRMHNYLDGSIVEAKFLHRTRPRLFSGISHVVQNRDLHDQGFLAPVKYHEHEGYDVTQIKRKQTGNFDDESLARYHQQLSIVEVAVEYARELAVRCNHILVFAANIAESREITTRLKMADVRAEHLDGKTNKATRENILKRFETGDTQVVSNCGVLTTGYDFPALDATILALPMMTLPGYMQRIGRVMRTHESKTHAKVADLCGNIERFGHPDRYWIEYENGQDHRLKSDQRYLTGVNFVDDHDMETARKNLRKAQIERARESPKAVVSFGKYEGVNIGDVPYGYLKWCSETFNNGFWKTIFDKEIARRKLTHMEVA